MSRSFRRVGPEAEVEAIVTLRPRKATAGTFRRPPAKTTRAERARGPNPPCATPRDLFVIVAAGRSVFFASAFGPNHV